jgi:hypothetical protein
MTYKDWITIQEQGLAAEYLQHPSVRVEALSSGSRSRRDRIDLTRNLYARRGADSKPTIPESWANRSQTDSIVSALQKPHQADCPGRAR